MPPGSASHCRKHVSYTMFGTSHRCFAKHISLSRAARSPCREQYTSAMVLHKIIASVFDWIYGERVEIFVQIALLRWSRTAHHYPCLFHRLAQGCPERLGRSLGYGTGDRVDGIVPTTKVIGTLLSWWLCDWIDVWRVCMWWWLWLWLRVLRRGLRL